MVSSTVCFSKYLSDKPTVSRVVPGPGFPIWYWLRGKGWDILKNMTKNCMRTTNSAFSGKTIKETGEDKPIFVVLKGFPHPPPPPPLTQNQCLDTFFTFQSPGGPRTHLINLRRMKGWVDLGALTTTSV